MCETDFSTFCVVDKQGTCIAVTVFNLAEGKGVIIGDSVAIPEPFVEDVDFTYKENVSFYVFNLLLNNILLKSLLIQVNNKLKLFTVTKKFSYIQVKHK